MSENKSAIMKRSWMVYLIGIVLFGLTYNDLKVALGGGISFVGAALLYLVLLRVIGHFVENKWHDRDST